MLGASEGPAEAAQKCRTQKRSVSKKCWSAAVGLREKHLSSEGRRRCWDCTKTSTSTWPTSPTAQRASRGLAITAHSAGAARGPRNPLQAVGIAGTPGRARALRSVTHKTLRVKPRQCIVQAGQGEHGPDSAGAETAAFGRCLHRRWERKSAFRFTGGRQPGRGELGDSNVSRQLYLRVGDRPSDRRLAICTYGPAPKSLQKMFPIAASSPLILLGTLNLLRVAFCLRIES